jgi:hypothetical protein
MLSVPDDDAERPSFETWAESASGLQPLEDLGWRIEYGVWELSRDDQRVPYAKLKSVRDRLAAQARKEGPWAPAPIGLTAAEQHELDTWGLDPERMDQALGRLENGDKGLNCERFLAALAVTVAGLGRPFDQGELRAFVDSRWAEVPADPDTVRWARAFLPGA